MESFLKGFVVGALVGATVALLLAPRKGLDTREVVFQRFQEAREAARQSAVERTAELQARYRQLITTSGQESPGE